MRFYLLSIQLLFTSLFFLTGCIGGLETGDFGSTAPPQNEPAYYGKPTVFSGIATVTISGKAEFEARVTTDYGLGPDVVTFQIPRAEFHVYSESQRIQQGETNGDGTFEFTIPKINGNYQVKVFSRAANAYLNVSVLDQMNTNIPYSIAQNFSLNDDNILPPTLSLLAYAHTSNDPEIRGGAFNIYYNIFQANEYLRRGLERTNSGNGAPTVITNGNWFVAPKLKIYWKAGFNPYTYFTNEPGASSFYIPSSNPSSRMAFILGGSLGNTSSADTDHFDNSVILHEYMHFLEDTFSNSSSAGGFHNGNAIIDPRLAWSEGLANYFQSAVQTGNDGFDANKDGWYLDTFGGYTAVFDLAAHGSDCKAPDYTRSDKYQHSGIYREISIARTLYKLTRNTSITLPNPEYVQTGSSCTSYAGSGITINATKGGGVPFYQIWKSLTGTGLPGEGQSHPSLKNTINYPISNAGIFTKLLVSNTGSLNAEAQEILDSENQPLTHIHYMPFLNTSETACPITFDGAAPDTYNNFLKMLTSNQMANNHFYLIRKSQLAANSIIGFDIKSTPSLNLDLMIYQKDYRYVEDAEWNNRNKTLLGYSRATSSSSSEYLDTRNYKDEYLVVNVKVKTPIQGSHSVPTTYQLRLFNGANLCPVAL